MNWRNKRLVLAGGGLLASSYSGLPNADARFDNFRVSGLPSTTSVQALKEPAAEPATQPQDSMQWSLEKAQPLWWEAILP